MKPKVYVETSVVSYLASKASRDVVIAGRQAVTQEWWEIHRNHFDLYISELVELEMAKGDPDAADRRAEKVAGVESLLPSEEAENLTRLLLEEGAVPVGSEEDAAHIAIASTQGMDFLLTWNFKHINNVQKREAIVAVVESCGFDCPILCSPEELGGPNYV